MKLKFFAKRKTLKNIKGEITRISALSMSLIFAASPVNCSAAENNGFINPACDEAYYATLDYYGNLKDASVVKSYTLNGFSSVSDYGQYDEIINLTDNTEPAVDDGKITFNFDDSSINHFYFEGKTNKPFSELPWKLSLSYRLNGVPKKAEELAGQTGEIEINIDALTNESASEYARNNETLEAIAVFNSDDILSLEAPGAQVQLLGNLRVVLFILLPGEEGNFTIRVGSNDFSFDGVTFMIAPATLSQLSDIAELRDAKEDIEDSYNSINDSLNSILDSIDGMGNNLDATADGLDKLNQARETISSGKDNIYTDLDEVLKGLSNIDTTMEPIEGDITYAKETLQTLKTNLSDMNDVLQKTSSDLDDARDALSDFESDRKDAKDIADDLSDTMDNLDNNLLYLESVLNSVENIGDSAIGNQVVEITSDVSLTVSQIESILSSMKALYQQYGQYILQPGYESVTFEQFTTSVLQNAPYSLPDTQISLYLGIWESRSEIEQELESANTISGGASTISSATASVIASLRELRTDDVNNLLDSLLSDAKNGTVASKKLIRDVQKFIDQIDIVHKTLDEAEPKLQNTLNDTISLSNSLKGEINALNTFMSETESLIKASGKQLDAGTKETLSALSAALRKSASSFNSTDEIRNAKKSISDLIEDKWDEYTGEKNNLLMMDSDALPVSLTSTKNNTPSSVQILIRTQEIKAKQAEQTNPPDTTAEKVTVWDRIIQMFVDFFKTIASFFNMGQN
ncbi:MAG: hypothetical protein VB120_05040 [Lachnospiraceae bacterium]|nr:hypothetical protein [Lachnospiraceae bacterium]